ncbi:hypothetical protein MKW98_028755, partial [Papaver atlanticum]
MEAAAGTTTPTTITSLNDDTTTQESVQKVALGAGVILNENHAGVHAIMAQTLPKYVIIQSNYINRYLRLYTEIPEVPCALRFDGDYSFDLDTRFEVVPAKSVSGLVHFLCLKNNKYCGNLGEGHNRIAAMFDKPEENQHDQHCTLFQPVFVYSNDNRVVKLRHVNTGHYIRGEYDYYGDLYLDTSESEVFTFIDWATVVVLPDLIKIKGVNSGNHLKAYGGDGFMDFNYQADNTS